MAFALPLTTDRLTLRIHRDDDLEPLLAVYADPDVARYLLDEPWTREVARQRLDHRLTQTGLATETNTLSLAIEHDGEVVGDVTLWTTDATGRKAEIGWVLASRVSGQGLATEAAGAVVAAGFEHFGLHRIEAQVDTRNTASANVAERLGMAREAHLRENWWSKGEWTSTWIYGLLASDRAA